MTREDRLLENYEDAVFQILMARVEQAEAAWASAELARLREDPDAAVPEHIDRCARNALKQARQSWRKQKRRVNFRRAMKAALIIIIVMTLSVNMVFARSPNTRARVMNTIRNVYETYTEVAFVGDEPIPDDLAINFLQMPEEFFFQEGGCIGEINWETFFGENMEYLSVEKMYPRTMAVDTENAVVTDIIVQGHEGTLIEKGSYVTVFWLNIETQVVTIIDTENVETARTLEIAENVT